MLSLYGSILANAVTHAALPKRASSIKSWDDKGFATKTGAALRAFAKGDKRTAYHTESVYSDANGPRSYVLFVIPYSLDGTTFEMQREAVRKGRVECFDYLGRLSRSA